MKILSGAYRKDAGHIFLDGQEVDIENPHHAQQLGIAIIYQEFNLTPNQTAAANIFIAREPRQPGLALRSARGPPQDGSRRAGSTRPGRRAHAAPRRACAISPSPSSRWWRSPRPSPSTPASSSWTSRPPPWASTRSRTLFEIVGQPQGTGDRRHLHQPPAGRSLPHRRSRGRLRDGQRVGEHAHRAKRHPNASFTLMVGAHPGRHVPQRGRRDRGARAWRCEGCAAATP